MTSGKKPIPMRTIVRRELPAYERKGALAQAVVGPEILIITLHQAQVDFETVGGVAAQVPQELREFESGISDTVLVGSVYPQGTVGFLDILMLDRKSQRGKPWKERLEILRKLHAKLPKGMQSVCNPAITWSRGLMKAFDMVTDKGGSGLLLRIDGQSKAVFCKREVADGVD